MSETRKSPTIAECIDYPDLLTAACATHRREEVEKIYNAIGQYLEEHKAPPVVVDEGAKPKGQEYFLYTDENGKRFYQLTLGRDTRHLRECLDKTGKSRADLLRVRMLSRDALQLGGPYFDPVEIPLTVDDALALDTNMTTAVENWLKCGIHPGECVWQLLRGNYEEAFSRAHELIKPHWDHHVRYIESLPIEARGSNMEGWQDYFESPV